MKPVQVTARIPTDAAELLQELAAAQGVTKTDAIVDAIYVAAKEKLGAARVKEAMIAGLGESKLPSALHIARLLRSNGGS
jgi:Ribbon-helix-helix protein, copG family